MHAQQVKPLADSWSRRSSAPSNSAGGVAETRHDRHDVVARADAQTSGSNTRSLRRHSRPSERADRAEVELAAEQLAFNRAGTSA